MSLLRHHGGAHPEAVTSIPASESQQTRNENSSTEPFTYTRRKFLRALMGAGGLVAAGGGVYAVVEALQKPAATTEPPEQTKNADTKPNFESQLTLNTIMLPETIDPKTFPEVFTNLGKAIQYDVNFGKTDDLTNLIPGDRWGTLQPGQFQVRADFLQGFRTSSEGTMMDRPNDPNDPRYYAWGFSIEMLEQLDAIGANPQDLHLLNVKAHVRITIGDLPPLITQTARTKMDIVEPHSVFETDMLLTRVKGMAGSNYVYVDDINGGQGYGWAIASVDKMQQLPSIMTGQNLPHQFPSTPPLFAQ